MTDEQYERLKATIAEKAIAGEPAFVIAWALLQIDASLEALMSGDNLGAIYDVLDKINDTLRGRADPDD